MCYTVPAAGAIVTTLMWHKTKDVNLWWLNLMMGGGALFGFIDHLWNKELFLISENVVSDLLLGCVITLSILAVWKVLMASGKHNPVLAKYLKVS